MTGRSRRISRGCLSVRSPSYRGWRSRPFWVHSANPISATSFGRTQCTWSPRGGSPTANGLVLDSIRPSWSRNSKRTSFVYPVPTLPAGGGRRGVGENPDRGPPAPPPRPRRLRNPADHELLPADALDLHPPGP